MVSISHLKPSALIRHSLTDLSLCEQDPQYSVSMSAWHGPYSRTNGDSSCEVCLAGAVMAQSLDAAPGREHEPTDFGPETCRSLYALNELRLGRVGRAFMSFPKGLTEGVFRNPIGPVPDRVISCYQRDRSVFLKDMNRLADDLEVAGY